MDGWIHAVLRSRLKSIKRETRDPLGLRDNIYFFPLIFERGRQGFC